MMSNYHINFGLIPSLLWLILSTYFPKMLLTITLYMKLSTIKSHPICTLKYLDVYATLGYHLNDGINYNQMLHLIFSLDMHLILKHINVMIFIMGIFSYLAMSISMKIFIFFIILTPPYYHPFNHNTFLFYYL